MAIVGPCGFLVLYCGFWNANGRLLETVVMPTKSNGRIKRTREHKQEPFQSNASSSRCQLVLKSMSKDMKRWGILQALSTVFSVDSAINPPKHLARHAHNPTSSTEPTETAKGEARAVQRVKSSTKCGESGRHREKERGMGEKGKQVGHVLISADLRWAAVRRSVHR